MDGHVDGCVSYMDDSLYGRSCMCKYYSSCISLTVVFFSVQGLSMMITILFGWLMDAVLLWNHVVGNRGFTSLLMSSYIFVVKFDGGVLVV